MKVWSSEHAKEKMVEKGISENEVLEGIKAGSKHVQEPDKIISKYRYYSVVYKKKGEVIFIITVKPRW